MTTTTDTTDQRELTESDFDWNRSYTKQTATYRELRIEIIQDDDPQNPRRDYDPYGVMACFHNRYDLGDADHGINSDDYTGWADMARHIEKDLDGRIIIPLYLYDHSGISMRAGSDFRGIDPGGWDSGQVGFIFATADWIRANMLVKRITKPVLDKVREGLLAAVEEYDDYLRGNCWGFNIVDPEADDDIIEDGSCWGFIGDLKASGVLDEAKAIADWYADKRDQRRVSEDFEAMVASDPMGMMARG